MNVLATGFEPFGKHEVNPSQLVAEALGGVVLPVSYARAADALRVAIQERDPDVVLCFGLADDRDAISIERFAHNLDEASTIDNESAPGSGAEIDVAGPLAYRSTLPVDAIVAALHEEDIPAAVSRDAGGFLCNHVFYVLMSTLGRAAGSDDGQAVLARPEDRVAYGAPRQIGGFVHVPPLEAVPLETLVRAARVIVATCAPLTSKS